MLIEHRRIPLFLLSAGVTVGCGAQVLDVGSPDAGPPVGHHRDFPPPSNSFGCTPGHENTDCWGTPCKGDVPPELAGPWIGQLSDVTFPSGSSALRIEVKGTTRDLPAQGDLPAQSGICGAVIFGAAAAPPIATDPHDWPPETSAPPPDGSDPKQQPLEGFRYEFWTNAFSLSSADATGAIPVPIALFSRQVYKSWCELQDSYTQPPSSVSHLRWACLPPQTSIVGCGKYIYDGGDPLPRWFSPPRCAQPDLCWRDVCDCDEGGCTIQNLANYAHPDIPFDIRLVPGSNSGNGTITWDGASHTVPLARTPLGAP